MTRRLGLHTIVARAWVQAMPQDVDKRLSGLLFVELYNKYREPNRTYHNLAHLSYMLNQMDEPWNTELVLATLYHDYYIGKQQSLSDEILSMAKAEQDLLSLGFTQEVCDAVCELIISTTGHTTDIVEKVEILKFLDMDLSILASDRNTYIQYMQDIKTECMGIYQLPEQQYIALRLKWIEKISKRESLFYTRPQQDIDQAFSNLKYECEVLSNMLHSF